MRGLSGAKAILVAGAVAFGAFAPQAAARPGDLDPAFGTGGVAVRGFGVESPAQRTTSAVEPLGVQPGGGTIVAGSVKLESGCGRFQCVNVVHRFVATRLNGDGSVDATFGVRGRVATSFGLEDATRFLDVAMQADGRILVLAVPPGAGQAYVFRVNPNGAVDGSFAGDGRAEITPSPGFLAAEARLAVQSDGRIVIAMVAATNTNDQFQRELFRLDADGAPDAGFASQGPEPLPGPAWFGSLVVDSQDRVVLGENYQGPAGTPAQQDIRRYEPGGAPDTGFGTAGATQQPATRLELGTGPRLVVDGADRILSLTTETATTSGGSHVVRLRADGTLDPAFGTGGIAALPIAATGVAAEPDGRVLFAVADSHLDDGGSTLELGRLLPNGTPDGTLGRGGLSTVYPAEDAQGAQLLPLAGDRVLLAAGQLQGTGALVARYRLATGPPDDLDADGVLDPADRCGGRYQPGAGCPRYKRKLTMHRTGRRQVRGKLFGVVSGCIQSVRIRFYGKRKGPDRALGSVTTDGESRRAASYATRLRRPFRKPVYARVSRRLEPTVGMCLAARSNSDRP